MSSWIHEPLNRQLLEDPRINGGRAWCVLNLNGNRLLRVYNSALTIAHYMIPFILNLTSALIILISTSRKKSDARHLKYTTVLKNQLNEHKDLLISPIILLLLALPRLIFTFAFSCIHQNAWQKYFLLFGYLLSFVPQTAKFLMLVLTSQLYKQEFCKFVKRQIKRRDRQQ
ncbi:unnamed protein product [Didymodactylos carnosus]|uniref:G-protein coupled receptors family 1 profile domain-containing protein n=1 Tax=Didymodactylos carnosus TaxID=1234261 RepID=A0A8S2D0Y1_9BILA|nr:unnamed protein product [Didymodactylos carnosus]CAF3634729.1 unnamed protein product [Didymodactylos carnosus]